VWEHTCAPKRAPQVGQQGFPHHHQHHHHKHHYPHACTTVVPATSGTTHTRAHTRAQKERHTPTHLPTGVRRGDATTDHAEPATGLRAGAGLSRDAATSVTAALRAAAKIMPASPLEEGRMGARLPWRSRTRPLGVWVPGA
jgi:hypothetical protein